MDTAPWSMAAHLCSKGLQIQSQAQLKHVGAGLGDAGHETRFLSPDQQYDYRHICIRPGSPPRDKVTLFGRIMPAESHRNHRFSQGIYAGLPVAIGYVPIAIAYGALGVASGLTWWHTVLMSLLVFAGAAQFMAVGMLAAGAGALQIIVATFVLNFRHLIMTLSLFDRLRSFSMPRRLAAALGITDETFAVLVVRADAREHEPTPRFVAGTLLMAYLSWVLGSAVGAVFAAFIPANISSGMSVALYAMFIALLMPALRKSAWAAVTAVLAMVLCYGFNQFLAPGWSIVCATLLAAFVGPVQLLRKPGMS